MNIKDFNDHVRVCSKVLYRGRICVVQDIHRREHTMMLKNQRPDGGFCQSGNRWIRCSEVDMIEQEVEDGTIKIIEV